MAARTITVKIVTKGANSASADVKKVGTSAKETTVKVKGLDKVLKELDRSNKQLQQSTKKQTQLQRGLTKSFLKGNIAARAITGAFNIFRRTVMTAFNGMVEFEEAFVRLSILSGASGESLKRLKGEILDVAIHSPKTADEVAKVGLEMSKLGLNAEGVARALKPVINLSVVMGSDLKTTGEALVNVKNVFKQTSFEMEKNADTLLGVFSNTALNMEKFRTSFSFVGKSAQLAGVSFRDTASIMGVLSSAGIRASTVGTQMRQVFLRLSNSASKAGKAIGGTDIQTIGLQESLKRLAPIQDDVTKLVDIFGVRAAGVASTLITNRVLIDVLSKATEDYAGLLEKAGEEQMKTFAGRMNQLTSSLVALGIALGETWVGGAFKGFIVILTGASMAITDLIKDAGLLIDLIMEFTSFDAKSPADWLNFEISDELASGLADSASRERDLTKFLKEGLSGLFDKDSDSLGKLQGEMKTVKDLIISTVKSINSELAHSLGDTSDILSDSLGNSDMDRIIANFELLQKRAAFFQQTLDPELMASYIDQLLEFREEFAGKGDLKGEGKALDALKRATGGSSKSSPDKLKATKDETLALAFANDTLTISFNSLSSAIDGLGDAFVESALRGGDAWNGFGTLMGDILKQMVAQLIAATIKLLLFRAITAAIDPTGAGAKFAVPLLANALGQEVPNAFSSKAQGMNSRVSKPTTLMVGESGPEDVLITPRAKTSANNSGGGVTVNINGDVFGAEKFNEAVRMANDANNRNLV